MQLEMYIIFWPIIFLGGITLKYSEITPGGLRSLYVMLGIRTVLTVKTRHTPYLLYYCSSPATVYFKCGFFCLLLSYLIESWPNCHQAFYPPSTEGTGEPITFQDLHVISEQLNILLIETPNPSSYNLFLALT